MSRLLRSLRASRGFISGFVIAAVLFGAAASAAEIIEKQITVYFPNYVMKFNGVRKAPPDDQKPVIIDGRTYVPLRFVAEAMGHPVEFDAAEQTIYVGARPEKNRPAVLLKPTENVSNTSWKVEGGSDSNPDWTGDVLYLNPARDINGVDRENSWIVQVSVPASNWGIDFRPEWVSVQKEYVLNGKYRTLSGTLFPGESYRGDADGTAVGNLVVKDEYDKVLYESPMIHATGLNDAVPFEVNVTGVGKIKLIFRVESLKSGPIHDKRRIMELGVENLGLN